MHRLYETAMKVAFIAGAGIPDATQVVWDFFSQALPLP
jgi:hypothetical protein